MNSTDLIAHARSFLHVREVTPNSSPEINGWQARLGCAPGDNYCACFACCMVQDVDPGNPLKHSASSLHLLANNPNLLVRDINDLQPGDIVVWDHGKGTGHTAIATQTTKVMGELLYLSAIAGNTSADGKSANGDRVAEHDVPLERFAGALRVCN